MSTFERSLVTIAFALGLPAALLASCSGSDGGGQGTGTVVDADGGGAGGAGAPDAHFPVVEPTDPCLVAGYYFDGESDCNVVRCPELTCECPSSIEPTPGQPPPAPEVRTLSGCVPERGCLSLLDCGRVCDPAGQLVRSACETRLASAGSLGCKTDDDCVVGHCRAESVGSVCIDALQCAEDGHCSAGFACLFDPGSLDPRTKFPTSLGACADGGRDSLCYRDDDCTFGSCIGNRCVGGLEGDACRFNTNCSSGFCRISSSGSDTGYCVSGKAGSSCLDDGDCGSNLHCSASAGACLSGDVGQPCDTDAECTSGTCVAGLCRGGEPGSTCEDDADCQDGVCAAYECTSGGLLAPCYEAADCLGGLRCTGSVCTDGALGSPCYTATDCAVLACVRGSCSDGASGAPCDSDYDCTSSRCADPAGVEVGECTTGAKGAHCLYSDDCISGSCSFSGTCN